MDLVTVFLGTFLMVSIGELGDKTQIASGVGALANKDKTRIIFFSSASALVLVAGITTFFAGLIPSEYLPKVIIFGGLLLIFYGIYLFNKAKKNEETITQDIIAGACDKKLFFTNFFIVFWAELGDKTQITTLAIATENQSQLITVFVASALALVFITAITVWGVTKIPHNWISKIQKLGALIMIVYGINMLI